ncbi:MAG TPA: hypothetical protein VEV39_15675 [Gemmatimonadales bacterium]|nr:hypothetical protein [Gemmatimonadales bacterium]
MLSAVAILACAHNDTTAPLPFMTITPLVDSLYAGDSAAALTATYYLGNGTVATSGPKTWSSSDTTVLRVDASTGALKAVGAGTAVLSVSASGVTGQALIVVTGALDLALLLPQIVLLPQDTFLVPFSVRNKAGGTPPAPWFSALANGYFTIDSATGLIVTTGTGASAPYHAFLDTLTADGTIQVISMGDTTGGGSEYTINGSVSAARSATVRGQNYNRAGGTPTFLLTFKVVVNGATTELVNILSQTAITAVDSISIDSVSVAEAESNTFLCSPPRSAAAWTSTAGSSPILAVSRVGGYVKVRKFLTVTGGNVIAGSFYFTGQRADDYNDPSGQLAIRGIFVAPLITNTNTCK